MEELQREFSVMFLTGQQHSSVCVLTTLAVQHMTREKTMTKRGISSLPAVHGPTADKGKVLMDKIVCQVFFFIQSIIFFISLMCGPSSQPIYCVLSHSYRNNMLQRLQI